MENHPIPQDVTGFQFKLIGNMTVKQFAYLATGLVFAWIFFQFPVSILIKFPFCAFSALFGIGLAYIPISGRPMDLMIGNYIKALLRPTQFVYEKTGGQIYFPGNAPLATTPIIQPYKNAFSPFPKDKLKAYLASPDTQAKNKLDEKESSFLMSVSSLATGNAPSQPAIFPSTSAPQPALQTYAPLPQAQVSQPLTQPITPERPTIVAQPVAAVQPSSPIPQPSVSLPVTPTTQPAISQPSLAVPAPQAASPRPIIKSFNRPIGMPSAPEYPNLIIGITKDARGNALPNILVEIKDKDGNPVRAFKTNELGRFASATPILNGSYSIEFEDPKAQNKFERIMVNVVGQIIQPIEAISVDTREELRRSLFATNPSQAN